MKWKLSVSILALLASTFCTIRVCAQERAHSAQAVNSGAWLKDPISNCAVWAADLKEEGVISWSGDCRDGKADGAGILSWVTNGKLARRYSGPMLGGKAQGIGALDFWMEGQYLHYEGSFVNSRLEGWGSVRWPDDRRLEGEFKDDALTGFVEYKAADGSTYTGAVKNDVADGLGHQILPGKEEYYGQFRQGKREGQGVLLLPNGDMYTGSFHNDKPNGAGKLQLASLPSG